VSTPSIASPEPSPAPAPVLGPRGWLALGAVLALALALRLHEYTLAPAFGDNADEVQFAWAGLNLIQHGDPYTWSLLPGYPTYTPFRSPYFATEFSMVHHWMDHPPLFSLIMGGWVWLLGDRNMEAVTPDQVRVLPVIFSTLSIGLVFLLARRLLGTAPALITGALLATAPAAVLFGREAEPESLLAVLLLAALLLTLRAVDGGAGRWSATGLVVCALLSPLLKVPGVAVGGVCAVVLALEGRWRLAAATLAGTVAGLLLFVAYGAALDWQQFVRTWTVQAETRSGVMSGFDFITASAGVNRRLRDGWWILGWIGLGLLAAVRERRLELLLVWPPVAYAAAMLVMAGEAQAEQYGWYRLIIYPSVYLGAGWLAWEAVRRPSITLLGMLAVLGGASATNWWLGGPDASWLPDPIVLTLVLAGVLLLGALITLRPDSPTLRRRASDVAVAVLAFMVLGNAVESLLLARIFTRM
jgi:4-amino-4-deoxy-L-arabinose transferase-like glycosyltransferase